MGGDFLFKRIICILLVLSNIGIKVDAQEISARSAVLYEPVTNRILYEKNAEQKLPMASTTKIITAITAIENGNLSDVITTSKRAADVEGSSVWLCEGEKQTLENLLYGLMLSSGNDAAIAIAEHIGGYDKFVEMMNNTAKKAGAVNTSLKNPNGLDEEGHYTTALDMALISAYAMKNQKFREIVSTKEKVIPWEGHNWGRTLKNHNKLLRIYEGANGIKTGFTKKDGRCLVSSAERNGVMLICVTLNAPNDWNDHKTLLDMGFSVLETKLVLTEDKTVKVENSNTEYITVKAERQMHIPVKQEDKTEVVYIVPETLPAPVRVNDVVGKAQVFLNGKMVEEVNMVARETAEKSLNFFDYFYKMVIQMLN